MTRLSGTVHVVDDDVSVRRALSRLLRAAGLQVEAFDSARAFLRRKPASRPACLLLDVQMPDLTGLDLQRTLIDAGLDLPVIFLSGHADIPMSVQAMKAGAVDFLTKPVEGKTLFAAVGAALTRDTFQVKRAGEAEEIQSRFATLTPRESEVLSLVVTGLLNKQIAAELGVSEKTVKVHRGRVMHKMQVTSVADLVRLAERSGIAAPSH
jgi:FixJ family two-component response regulator